jgi:hypothetical protein
MGPLPMRMTSHLHGDEPADRRNSIFFMSQRLDKSWSVLVSHQTADASRCVDIFSRPNHTYGFEEFRREPEDMGGLDSGPLPLGS